MELNEKLNFMHDQVSAMFEDNFELFNYLALRDLNDITRDDIKLLMFALNYLMGCYLGGYIKGTKFFNV